MSASAEIFRFPGPAANGNSGFWSNQDIADVYRCLDQFSRHGLTVEAASGLSDEGDPWFAIEDMATGDALVHIARIDGFFVVHVLDGETWSGDTLRQALSGIDFSSLAGVEAPAHHDATATDGDDDKDGTHAFLRIVSAVMAALTTEVIANAVTHDAVASPLPPSGAPDAGDHGVDATNSVLDLPAVDSNLPNARHTDVTDTATSGPAETPAPVKVEHSETVAVSSSDTPTSAPVEKPVPTLAVIDISTTSDVVDTGTKQAIAVPTGQSQGVALSFTVGSDHIQVSFDSKVTFVGTEKKTDTFLIVLDGHGKDLTAKVENFDKGQDSLVIEKSGDGGTSSAIVTDLGALVANSGSHLTVIGQATVEIHLTSTPDPLVAGG
jgi:hypothetical protein